MKGREEREREKEKTLWMDTLVKSAENTTLKRCIKFLFYQQY